MAFNFAIKDLHIIIPYSKIYNFPRAPLTRLNLMQTSTKENYNRIELHFIFAQAPSSLQEGVRKQKMQI